MASLYETDKFLYAVIKRRCIQLQKVAAQDHIKAVASKNHGQLRRAVAAQEQMASAHLLLRVNMRAILNL